MIDNRLQRIANFLLLNASFIDDIGLLNGKMGIAIFFYHYSRYCGNKIYEDYAGELIDEIYEEINNGTPVNFATGLTGIGWGIEYLIENKFVDADSDEALVEIDNAVYLSMLNSPLLLDNGNDLFGYGLYYISRLRGHEHYDENLTTLIKKEQLIYLTDECERLLVLKRYLEFNILQFSALTLSSLLWFLLEMKRLAIFPSKVRKIFKYLPDYLSHVQEGLSGNSDMLILHALSKKAFEQLTDESLKEQYLSIVSKTENDLNICILDEKSILTNLQSVYIQRLIYSLNLIDEPYYYLVFEKVLSISNNEDEWKKTLDGINKSNLGLTGLAGFGLLLMEAHKLNNPDVETQRKSSLIGSVYKDFISKSVAE